jgi:PAS domain S-box-containing protein
MLFRQSMLIAGLPFLLAGTLVLFWLLPQIDRDIEVRQLQLARSVGAQVSSYLLNPQRHAEGLALLAQEQTLDPADLQRVFDAQLAVSPTLHALYLVDGQDRIVVVGLKPQHQIRRVDLIGTDLSRNRLLQQARQTSAAVWSDTFLSLITEGISVAFALPAGQGILIGEIELTQLSGYLHQISGGSERLLQVLDAHGQVIADEDGLQTAQQLNVSNLPLVATGRSGTEQAHGRFQFEGTTYLGSLVRVPSLNWLVLVALPVQQAYQTVGTSLRITLAGLLAALVFALLLAYFLSRRLAASFEALTAHARQTAAATPPEPSLWPRANILEFQALADDLQLMSNSLRERERQLTTLMSNLPGMAYRCRADAERSWEFISDGCRALVGCTEQELLSGSYPGLNALIQAEELPEVVHQLNWQLEHQQPYQLIYRLRNPQGGFKWVLDHGRGVLDGQGRLLCLEGLVTDITAEQLADEALKMALAESQEAKDRVELILRSVADGLVFTDLQGRILLLSASAEELLGIKQQQAKGLALGPLASSLELQHLFAGLQQVGGETAQLELALPGPDPGGRRDLEVKAALVRSRDGAGVGIITLLRDVSRERQLDRMKSEFVSTAAHELRTPLTVIMGFSEVLLDEQGLASHQQEYLRIINDKAEVLQRLIDDLLDLGRVESGRMVHVEKSRCDLAEVIRQAITDFQLTHTRHRFAADLPGAPVELEADPLRLAQILENLLGNAVKFSPAGSLIQLSCCQNGAVVEVSVRDQGVGMTPEQVGRVFEKFYRVDSTATSKQGLGLGMTIVKNIIDAHGGEIRVESWPGEGTEIVISLPLDAIEAST